MDDQSMTQQGAASDRAEAWSPGATERQDEARSSGAYVDASVGGAMPYFPAVHEALLGGEAAARQAGRQVLSAAYERHRIEGIAALEMAAANAGVVVAILKWSGEDFEALSNGLDRIEALLATARDAIEARMQLAMLDAQAEHAHAERAAGAR